MYVEEGTSNGDAAECSEGLQCLKSKAVDNVGGFGTGNNDLAGWNSGKTEGFRTYKRRKHAKSSSESKSEDEGRAFAKDEGQMSHKVCIFFLVFFFFFFPFPVIVFMCR